MGIRKKILILPHIGTAYGHLIRLSKLASGRYYDKNLDIFFVVPNHVKKMAKRFVDTSQFKLIFCKNFFSVTSKTGSIDYKAMGDVLEEYLKITKTINPDLIIGSPGIEASVVGTSLDIPWESITHGLYLPNPLSIEIYKNDINSLEHLASQVWKVARKSIDSIVLNATKKEFTTWNEIQSTGKVTPVYSEKNQGNINKKLFKEWENKPVDLLITKCSDGLTSLPSLDFLKKISKFYSSIAITDYQKNEKINNICFIGNNYSYQSLIDDKTIVICHGGCGTIEAVEKAKKVIIIPGDLDQLYNSIIAQKNLGYSIFISKSWYSRLNSPNPFKREVDWGVLDIDNSGNFINKGIKFDLEQEFTTVY